MSKKTTHVFRYSNVDRLMHWMVALGFVLLFITGFLIFFQSSAALLTTSIGKTIRVIHRVGAVLFLIAPVIYFIFSKKRFGWLYAFKWDKSDLGWLKAAPKHYFVGGGMPPQGKYNTGQKLYYLFVILLGPILAFTGLALWFDWFSGKAAYMMLLLHDVSAVGIGAFFFVHVYLTSIHPRERKSFEAMYTGYMEKDYAEHHHQLWYDEVKETQLVSLENNAKKKKMGTVKSYSQ